MKFVKVKCANCCWWSIPLPLHSLSLSLPSLEDVLIMNCLSKVLQEWNLPDAAVSQSPQCSKLCLKTQHLETESRQRL